MTSLLESSAAKAALPDLARLVERVRYYGNRKFAFGVLAHGTCFFPRIGEPFTAEAGKLLDELEGTPLDFTVREMDDHNFVVKFNEHVFAVVLRDEFAAARAQLDLDMENSVVTERLLSRPDSPREHALIGIFARTRLSQDLLERRVVQMEQGA